MEGTARVAASEHRLLTLARAVVGEGGPEAIASLIRSKGVPPRKLGPTSMRLLRETLARGVVLELARRGGWQPVKGRRLWERVEAPELAFGAPTFELLAWIAAGPLAIGGDAKLSPPDRLGSGDEVVFHLACDLLVGSGVSEAVLEAAPVFRRSALCRLAWPDLLGRDPGGLAALSDTALPELWLLEALQADLATRWVAMERSKSQITSPPAMLRLTGAQETVVSAFLSAVDQAGRRDLADFLVETAVRLLDRPVSASAWSAALDPRASLAERAQARKAAGCFLRALSKLKGWTEEARLVRFFEEGYDRAQLWLARWERIGEDRSWQRVEGIVRELESLEGAPA